MSVTENEIETSDFDEIEDDDEGMVSVWIIICAIVLIVCCSVIIAAFVIIRKRRNREQDNAPQPKDTNPQHMMAVPSTSTMFDYDNGSIQMSMNGMTKQAQKRQRMMMAMHRISVPSTSVLSVSIPSPEMRSSVKGMHLVLPGTPSAFNVLDKLTETPEDAEV